MKDAQESLGFSAEHGRLRYRFHFPKNRENILIYLTVKPEVYNNFNSDREYEQAVRYNRRRIMHRTKTDKLKETTRVECRLVLLNIRKKK